LPGNPGGPGGPGGPRLNSGISAGGPGEPGGPTVDLPGSPGGPCQQCFSINHSTRRRETVTALNVSSQTERHRVENLHGEYAKTMPI